MHTIIYRYNVWQVVRCEICDNKTTIHILMFDKLSFNTAMAVANSLNGGSLLSPDLLKVLEMCKA